MIGGMEITELLHRVRDGDQDALNAVIPWSMKN